jgi:hypothetical protein
VQGGTHRTVRERRPEEQPSNRALDYFIGWIRGVVGLFVLGLLLELLSPGIGGRTMAAVTRSPAMSLLWGIVLFVLLPLVAVIVFVLGLIVGGWWIGTIIIAVYGMALISSVALAGIAIGRWLLERFGRPTVHFAWALLLGVSLLALVGLVPLAGGLLVGLITLFAFGGLVLSMFGRRGMSEVVAELPPPPPDMSAPAPSAPA